MSKEEFMAKIILDHIEREADYPDDNHLAEIKKLADFAYGV